MSKTRYTCEWTPASDIGDTRVITVKDAKATHYREESVQVWWYERSSTARCCRCSGPLSAMSASCPHARAARKFALSETVKE